MQDIFSNKEKIDLLRKIAAKPFYEARTDFEMALIEDRLVKEGYVKILSRYETSEHFLCEITSLGKAFIERVVYEDMELNKVNKFVEKKKIFIVHGHDGETKEKVARFIEKIGFEAIILHEQTSSSLTIIEKLEKYTDVGYAIVLYTPCDKGGKNVDRAELKPRARQNVVFEHGYLLGKLGRDKVCALVKDENIEKPSDVLNIVYIPMDDNDGWKIKIANEMKSCGFEIDMNKLV